MEKRCKEKQVQQAKAAKRKQSDKTDKAIGRNKRGKSKAAAFVRLRQEEHK